MVGEGEKPKAVIVGGSIAGISSAHALTLAGWDVLVLEKTTSPPTGSPTGAGLGLNSFSQQIINSWLHNSQQLLHNTTLPLTIDQVPPLFDAQNYIPIQLPWFFSPKKGLVIILPWQNHATDSEKKVSCTLTRDESFNFRAAHWADLHGLLYNALPSNVFLWGHLFLSFHVADDKGSVIVKAEVLESGKVIEIVGDLLVAADGCLSSIRHKYLPHFKLRYSGYCAWRGVLDFSKIENSETIIGMRKAYPDLGKCLYFDLASGTHSVLYELLNKKLNWIWYVNQPEPEVKGTSVTMKVNSDMIQKMHQEAEKVWIPELVKVIKETRDPFLNFIYDSDPLEKIFWDNVVLVGDAAHPTTPHCLRSTNMSILDAAVLGKCLEKFGAEKVRSALEEYQFIRLPETSKQVLHARRLGRIKQGLVVPDREPLNPKSAKKEDCEELLQSNTPFFNDVPSILASILPQVDCL
uniref:3-hydroxybenzoate 6-hydroxylase n=1 Tax=Cajanus cajan TaxID=3821 RepID=A0A151TZF4_CAJCA|nr:3-hydroxybenzoate 6-hydroxylase [Cajanus cajan]